KRRADIQLLFRLEIHNPPTINNVSACMKVVPTAPDPDVISKDICLPIALQKVFRVQSYFSVRLNFGVRLNLTYSSHGVRGWEYNDSPKCHRSDRQWPKDYQPQKRITLVPRKPISCFSKILNKGQCQTSD